MILAFALIGLGLLNRLKKRKKNMELTADDKIKAFKEIERLYGKEKAQLLEKVFRLETAHFTSKGFKNTFSAGMEAVKPTFPYGWTSLSNYWKMQPDAAPEKQFIKMTDIGGRKVNFLQFKSFLGALKTAAKVFENRDWNVGTWYSLVPEKQAEYISKINTIKNKYIV